MPDRLVCGADLDMSRKSEDEPSNTIEQTNIYAEIMSNESFR